jgi:hypothetical protein
MLLYWRSRKEASHAWDPRFNRAPMGCARRGSARRGPDTFRPIIAFPCGVLDAGGLADSLADSGGLANTGGVANYHGLAHPDFLATIGDTKMTILNSPRFKRFILGRKVDAAETTRTDDSQLPIPDYDRIKDKELIGELSKHSQTELAAIESYERSHKDRPPVLNKLRYLRGQEPLQDYDALSVKEILAGLEGADTPMLQRTRVYERKFQRRPDVLEEVATSIRERRPGSGHRG